MWNMIISWGIQVVTYRHLLLQGTRSFWENKKVVELEIKFLYMQELYSEIKNLISCRGD
jgi:hypothetical protein